MKDRVETLLHRNPTKLRRETLMNALTEVLTGMENDSQLFQKLLHSFPARLEAVRAAQGGHTNY